MRMFCVIALAAVLYPAMAAAQAGDAKAGQMLWDSATNACKNCHGAKGEGGFGPDLAGRHISVAQFTRAVRKPWGIMPSFNTTQVSDAEMANLVAYFDGMPSGAQPGAWRTELPANAPKGQETAIATVGCAQCHGATLNAVRQGIGSINGDFEWFKREVYQHSTEQPHHFTELGQPQPERLRMGDYNPQRLTESTLLEIFNFARDIGARVPVTGQLSSGVQGTNGVTYTLNVANGGLAGKGLTAEELTVAVVVPAGATVVSATGPGYQGVKMDEQVKANAAVWTLPRLAPGDKQNLTLTLSKAGTPQDNVRGAIRWPKPAIKPGPNDQVNIPPAPIAPSTR